MRLDVCCVINNKFFITIPHIQCTVIGGIQPTTCRFVSDADAWSRLLVAEDMVGLPERSRIQLQWESRPQSAVSAFLWRICGRRSVEQLNLAAHPFIGKPPHFVNACVATDASILRQTSKLMRAPEGRPYFLSDSPADISVSHSEGVMTFCVSSGDCRIGVDVEAVSHVDQSGSQSFRTFIEQRTLRLLPNFCLTELWWLLNFTRSRGRCGSDRCCGEGGTELSPPPFAPFQPHKSISSSLARTFFSSLSALSHRCAACFCQQLELLQRRLYLLWTMKEAVVKALGWGIPFGMQRIHLHPASWAVVDDSFLEPEWLMSLQLCCGIYVDGTALVGWNVSVFSGSVSKESCVGSIVSCPLDEGYLIDAVKGKAAREGIVPQFPTVDVEIFDSMDFCRDVLKLTF